MRRRSRRCSEPFPRRAAAAAAFLFLSAAPLPPPAAAQAAAAPETQRWTRRVGKGVELFQEVVPAGAGGGPLVVSALRVDLKARGVRVEAALGQDRVWNAADPTFGRERVSRLAARRKAVAGINAAFFPFAGNPLGIHLENGDLVIEPNRRSALVLLADGTARIDTLTFAGVVRGGASGSAGEAGSAPIHGLNRRPGKGNELLLFTPRFADATPPAGAERYEVVLGGIPLPLLPGKEYAGTVTYVGAGGATPLAPNTVALSGGGAAAAFLRARARLDTRMTFRLDVGGLPRDAAAVRAAVAGGPRLLAGGRVTVTAREEGFTPEFANARHPRTAAGVTPEGILLLVTIDGRQAPLSRGASLAETAAILLKLGARDAVNLDGGGSTALVVRDALVNSPSEGAERPVASALLVFDPSAPAAPERTVRSVAGPRGPLAVGQFWRFTPNPPAGESAAIGGVWGTTGGVGFVDQAGRFRALRPGTGTVRWASGASPPLSFPVTVEEAPPPPALPPTPATAGGP